MVKKVVYVAVIAAFLGQEGMSIEMGPFDLSFFRAIIFLTSIAWVFHMISSRGTIVLRLYKGNKYSVLFFLVWFLYAALTLTWVKDYLGWMRAMYFLGLGLICIVVYSSMLETQGDIQTTFRLMTIMAGFHNVIGWYESLAGNYLFLRIDRVERYLMTGRPVSTFRNTNDFATFMLFSVFIAYVCLANSKSMKGKCFYATIMFSSGALVFRTLSRANILGLLVAILVFVGLSMKKSRRKYGLIFGLSTLSLVVLAKLDAVLLFLNERIYFDFVSNRGSDYVRTNLIKNGILFLEKTFGLGTGAGNIEYWMENRAVHYVSGVLMMHNWWVEILVAYGALIFVLYVIFYVNLWLSMYRTYRDSSCSKDRSISIGIMCCMAGYVIGSVSASSNISVEWLWSFWGLCIVYQGITSTTKRVNVLSRAQL